MAARSASGAAILLPRAQWDMKRKKGEDVRKKKKKKKRVWVCGAGDGFGFGYGLCVWRVSGQVGKEVSTRLGPYFGLFRKDRHGEARKSGW